MSLLPGTKIRFKHHEDLHDWNRMPESLQQVYLKLEGCIYTISGQVYPNYDRYAFVEDTMYTATSKCFDVVSEPTSNYSIEEFEDLFA